MRFKELRLAEPIVCAVAAEGYTAPTPIQTNREDEFEIAIGDEEAGKLQPIGDVVEFIAKQHESSDRMQQGLH